MKRESDLKRLVLSKGLCQGRVRHCQSQVMPTQNSMGVIQPFRHAQTKISSWRLQPGYDPYQSCAGISNERMHIRLTGIRNSQCKIKPVLPAWDQVEEEK